MAAAPSAANTQLSEYEQQRLRNMEANSAVLAALGIDSLAGKKTAKPRPTKRSREPRLPTRESLRSRSLPVPVYAPGLDEALAEVRREQEIREGSRMPDGTWLGERFGEVEGVKVGTVFGAGDYQRLGRQEMMESGFFRPFVTPEWCVPGVGCFAIVVNNDNGASTDMGDTILYAGSGGRRRGQNRTAPQSFDQDWSNVTNAALRLNYDLNKPVRVVRGPKLVGLHGTAKSGGGYRYDGLYRVASAEMVRSSSSGLLTAMFELRKL